MINSVKSTERTRKYKEKFLCSLTAGVIAATFIESGLAQLPVYGEDYLYLKPLMDEKSENLVCQLDKALNCLLLGYSGYSFGTGFETKREDTRSPFTKKAKKPKKKEKWQDGDIAYYISGGMTYVVVKGYDWTGSYYFYRLGKNFGRVSLFGQISRDELGKTYGIGINLYLIKGFYLFHYQGQGIDNVDMINHKWVYTYPEELVVQHAFNGHGLGYHHYRGNWGFLIEYSRDRLEFGDDRGGAWTQKAEKINLGVSYRWR